MIVLIQKRYTHAYYGVKVVDVQNIPFTVHGMFCEDLQSFPKEGEIINLGMSGAHYSPSDVQVKLASKEAEAFLKSLINLDHECYVRESQLAWDM